MGENASGKTVWLKQFYSMHINDSVINTETDHDYHNLELDDELLYHLMNEIDEEDYEVSKMGNNVFSKNLSTQLCKIITLLCKRVKYVLLDEPEFDLAPGEIYTLDRILYFLAWNYKDKQVYIVTHDEILKDMQDNAANKYTVKRGIDGRVALEELHEYFV